MGRPTRRVTIAASFIAVMFAGGVATGMTGDDSSGRDGSTQPGAPADVPAPAPIDSDAGRSGSDVGKAPKADAVETQSAVSETPLASRADNGRGGRDPASGPLAVVQSEVSSVSAESLSVGASDTDSGKKPKSAKPPRSQATADATAEAAVVRSAPVDQDVPGAPTGGPPGADLPSNDADG